MDIPTPADPSLAHVAGPHAKAGLRFALVVFPESLQQRWHAVLLPDPTPAAVALEFATPLDLLRHLAQLLPLSPAHPDPSPREASGARGLR
ncbi:MAG: hypothetical protein ABJA61_03705 [Caldimonas sp.]